MERPSRSTGLSVRGCGGAGGEEGAAVSCRGTSRSLPRGGGAEREEDRASCPGWLKGGAEWKPWGRPAEGPSLSLLVNSDAEGSLRGCAGGRGGGREGPFLRNGGEHEGLAQDGKKSEERSFF